MTILITAASGHLGHLVVEALLARGADPATLIAGARTPAKADDLAAQGVRVVPLDYEDPATIAAALHGVDKVLLISGSAIGQRATQHQSVIDAAKAANVKLLAYTSLLRADTSPIPLAGEHIQTEQAIAAAGLPAVLLRNGWYTENYLPDLERARQTGEVTASAGSAQVASASRADYAAAAAAVLLAEDEQAGRVYELAGDTAWSYPELATTIGELIGRPVAYHSLTTAEHIAALESAGLDAGTAGFIAAIDTGIAAGGLDSQDKTLSRLIGRPTTTLRDTLYSQA